MSQLLSIADLRADAPSPAPLNSDALQAPEPGGFGAVFDLASLDGANGFRIDGGSHGAYVGFSVASVGDFNGDGFSDIVIGAPYSADPTGVLASAGAAYVIFGHAGPFDSTVSADALDGSNGFSIRGVGDYQGLGYSVASAGDINGDGFDDLVIGSNAYGGSPRVDYVVFGTDSEMRAEFDLTKINGKNGFSFFNSASSISRVHVASAGDFNGDGVADMIVSDFDTNGSRAGSSWMVFGTDRKFASSIDLAHLNGKNGFHIPGIANYGQAGRSVASAGDVNGDGFDDVIIGAPYASPGESDAGSTYVVFGGGGRMPAELDLSTLDGTNGFRLDGDDVGGKSGWSVASAGDVNGDGFADLIIGAVDESARGEFSFSGASYVVFGKAAGFAASIDLSGLDGTSGFKIIGPVGEQEIGWSVASAGDLNGDGFSDLIIGTPFGFSNGVQTGAAYVVFGKAGGFGSVFDLSALNGSGGFKIEGVSNTDESGWSVASAGDVNGDGLADMIVGAPYADQGTSYVIFGVAPTKAVHLTGTVASQSLVGGELKDVLSGLGGDDMLWGHGGKDRLTGGTGDDTLVGGAGKDVLIGSAGADVFQYRDLTDSTAKAHDIIKAIGKTDVIDLHLLDANVNKAGDQAFHLVSAFSGAAGELVVSYDGKQTLVQGDVDGDGTADLVIAISGDHHDFANFVL